MAKSQSTRIPSPIETCQGNLSRLSHEVDRRLLALRAAEHAYALVRAEYDAHSRVFYELLSPDTAA